MAKVNEPYVKVDEYIMQAPTVASTASTSNIGGVIVSPVGPRLAYVTSPVEFLKLYTVDGQTIPRNADITFINAYYLSYYSGLVISRSLNTNAVGGVLVYQDTENNATVTKLRNFITKDGIMLTKASKLNVVVTGVEIDGASPVWAFALGEIVYYSSNMSLDALISMPVFSQFNTFKPLDNLQQLVSSLENTDGVHVKSSNLSVDGGTLDVIMEHTEDENTDTVFKYEFDIPGSQQPQQCCYGVTLTYTAPEEMDPQDESEAAALNEVALPPSNKWIFSILGDLPLGSDSNTITLSNYSSATKSFDLELNDSVYRVSLDKFTTENGVNIYIEYINTQKIGFTVTVYNGDLTMEDIIIDPTQYTRPTVPTTPPGKFGNSGFRESDSKGNSHIIEALDYLADQELYDVEYLASFGLTDAGLMKRYQLISKEKKWFCPIDIPQNCTTYTSVKRYAETFMNYENMPSGIVLGPFDRNTSLTGWYNDIAASTLYYERVMLNKQANAEFAPVFRNEYGKLNYNYPYKIFRKSERTDLLSLAKPINWAVYDQREDIYYLNDNRTFQEDQESVVCEEQNARIVWKISKDVARIVDNFIGQYNTRTTRASVTDAIKYYLDWNIMNKKFPPEAYLVQCDEYNNPDSLINENKLAVELKIRLYKAIKYIEVVNRVFPLGVDFNTSI